MLATVVLLLQSVLSLIIFSQFELDIDLSLPFGYLEALLGLEFEVVFEYPSPSDECYEKVCSRPSIFLSIFLVALVT